MIYTHAYLHGGRTIWGAFSHLYIIFLKPIKSFSFLLDLLIANNMLTQEMKRHKLIATTSVEHRDLEHRDLEIDNFLIVAISFIHKYQME